MTISAVASATPSINPTTSALAPSVVTRNTGSRLWIISDEMSISRLTKPSVQIAAGKRALLRHCVDQSAIIDSEI